LTWPRLFLRQDTSRSQPLILNLAQHAADRGREISYRYGRALTGSTRLNPTQLSPETLVGSPSMPGSKSWKSPFDFLKAGFAAYFCLFRVEDRGRCASGSAAKRRDAGALRPCKQLADGAVAGAPAAGSSLRSNSSIRQCWARRIGTPTLAAPRSCRPRIEADRRRRPDRGRGRIRSSPGIGLISRTPARGSRGPETISAGRALLKTCISGGYEPRATPSRTWSSMGLAG